MESVRVANLRIDNLSWEEALVRLQEFIQARKPRYIISPNVDGIIRYNEDREYARYCDGAALSLVDGVPVLWAAKFLGTPLKAKISGSDFVPRICQLSQSRGYRIFFMGGRPGAVEQSKAAMEKQYPGTQIVGTYCPPLGFENSEVELERLSASILAAKPDIVFVGLGYPKQDRWIEKYHQSLNIPVCMGVGATFDFLAGMVKRAPLWMQRLGLEWFWRLVMEPGRLWKRYLVDDLKFFPLVIKQKFSNRAVN